ncbi:MAG TPA: dihydrodipicolinate synthase family protein [Chloroflexota bacterium]|nr:dihydrodipicolinate synthase family protein [Chloroflexota bacterium]
MSWRGIFGILLTTYSESDEVSLDDLTSQADFVAATAQGIVWPVLASEFYLLDNDERAAGYPAVVAGNGGRVPFVAGVSSPTTRSAAKLAEAAAKAGADAVIAMAPYMKRATPSELTRHFAAIAAAGLPVFIQNAAYLSGACTLTPDDLRRLTGEIPQIQYLKEEAPVLPQTISNILEKVPGVFRGVFGGGGARFLIDELNRGGAGNMPACEWADVFGHAFALYEQGEIEAARRVHVAALQGMNFEAAYGMVGAAEALHRRGILRSTHSRYATPRTFDAAASAELDAVLQFLGPYLRWPAAGTS